jgi:hypothetical protein
MKAVITKDNGCILWHSWKFVKVESGVRYYRCKCGARMAIFIINAPVRWNWLSWKTNLLKRSPVKEK